MNTCKNTSHTYRAVARLLYQGGQAVDKRGQAKFSKYYNLIENHLKLVLKFLKRNNFTNKYEKWKIC